MDDSVKIELEVRRDKAEAELRRFEMRAANIYERLERVRARYEATPNAFNRNTLNAVQGAFDRNAKRIADGRRGIEAITLRLDQEEARKGGRLFGMQVSKQLEGIVKQLALMHFGGQAVNLGFAMMRDPTGDNRGIDMAQEGVNGAMGGAMAGAAFGPWGMAIGACVGGLLGVAEAANKAKKDLEAERSMRASKIWHDNINTGLSYRQTSSDFLLSHMSRPEKLKRMHQMLKELESGEGDFSVKSQKRFLDKFGTDTKSLAYQDQKKQYEMAQERVLRMREQIFNEQMQTRFGFTDPSKFADSFARQGLYAGGRADVTDVNKGMLDELKAIRTVAQEIAGDMSVVKKFDKVEGYAKTHLEGRWQ